MNGVRPQNQLVEQNLLQSILPACVIASAASVISVSLSEGGKLDPERFEKTLTSSIWIMAGIVSGKILVGPGSLDLKVQLIYYTVTAAELMHVTVLAPSYVSRLWA